MPGTILIVDDDPVQRRLLEGMVQRFGYDVVGVGGGQAALDKVLDSSARIDCIVLDLLMPDLDGFGVLAALRQAGARVPVIVQTGHGGIDNVSSATRAGAVDFVTKPVGPERLKVSLRNALAVNALESELQRLKRAKTGTLTFKDVVSRSPRMRHVIQSVQKAAGSDTAVLLEGESGVGKELIARAIHGSSRRRAKPFVAVNCGAIPQNLMESALFGHERGAFTGAA
jgi:DNA-binding NtrC family response regulator